MFKKIYFNLYTSFLTKLYVLFLRMTNNFLDKLTYSESYNKYKKKTKNLTENIDIK